MNMDFVQRNLINERNNLQVELAKAKLLIAELSEMATTPKREQEHMDSLKQTMREIASAAGRFRAAPYGDGVEAKFDDRINAAYNQLRGINTERRSRKLIDAGGKVVKPSKSQKPSDTTPHDLTYKGTEGSEYGHISGIVRQMRKAHKRTLSEMRVVDSMKSGGVGSAINAVKRNIKQRGILGGLGINPKKGFIKKLGVPLVKGDDGNLSEPILGTVDKSSKGRAANRVIIGAAESEIMSQASFGPSNIKKVKRGETMVKKPINPHYGIEGTAQYEQAEYISDLENVIVTIAESINVSAADLYETYRITPARRALLDKIQSIAMRDAADAMGPDGEDFRASSIKKSDAALSRISRIELMKMKGKPSDKRTHDQHPMHRFFPDDRSPNQLTDRALNADLAAERKREISNRPKKKKAN